ncbi:MAG: hypothetical protein ACOZBZ_02780 [Patescibacteria group bacterium]
MVLQKRGIAPSPPEITDLPTGVSEETYKFLVDAKKVVPMKNWIP